MKASRNDPRHRHAYQSSAILMATAIGISAVLTGCGTAMMGAPPCMPPDYSVSPSMVQVGDIITIQAQDADCDPRYGQSAQVEVTLKGADGADLLRTTAPMNDAGGFTYSVEIPQGATPGTATVEAYPYGVDWCDDTGRNNRVSRADDAMVQASCAARIETLTITS